MAAFVVADNLDGTGATATVTGSVVGSTNEVFASRSTGKAGALPFALAGSRLGDGPIDLPLSPGLWLAYMLSDGVFGGQYYFATTSGLDAVATRVRRAVIETIRLLTIPPAAHVYEQQFPDPGNVTFPCVLCTVEGVQETQEQGLSTRDDIGRPVKVQIADRVSHRDPAKLPAYELWRQSVDRCFRNQQLAGVPESVICRIEPYDIIDPMLPQYQFMVSGLVVRAVCREPRGVGV